MSQPDQKKCISATIISTVSNNSNECSIEMIDNPKNKIGQNQETGPKQDQIPNLIFNHVSSSPTNGFAPILNSKFVNGNKNMTPNFLSTDNKKMPVTRLASQNSSGYDSQNSNSVSERDTTRDLSSGLLKLSNSVETFDQRKLTMKPKISPRNGRGTQRYRNNPKSFYPQNNQLNRERYFSENENSFRDSRNMKFKNIAPSSGGQGGYSINLGPRMASQGVNGRNHRQNGNHNDNFSCRNNFRSLKPKHDINLNPLSDCATTTSEQAEFLLTKPNFSQKLEKEMKIEVIDHKDVQNQASDSMEIVDVDEKEDILVKVGGFFMLDFDSRTFAISLID